MTEDDFDVQYVERDDQQRAGADPRGSPRRSRTASAAR